MMELLEPNLRLLQRLEDERDSDEPDEMGERQSFMDTFLMNTFEIGLEVSRNPSMRETAEFKAYLEASNRRLVDFKHRVQVFIDRTRRKFGFTLDYNDYIIICRRRSAIAFLEEFAKNTPFEVAASLLDTLELDEVITETGSGYIEAKDIPPEIPASHWWWQSFAD
jgi:hypothetical protein